MRYIDWDTLRQELFFTESEERAITKRAAELTRYPELADQIARAVAEVDSHQWGLKLPGPDHPLWQVYAAYGEAVLRVLQGETVVDSTGFEPPPDVVRITVEKEAEIPESSDIEIDAVFKSAAADSCAEGNHIFCQPGCTGPAT